MIKKIPCENCKGLGSLGSVRCSVCKGWGSLSVMVSDPILRSVICLPDRRYSECDNCIITDSEECPRSGCWCNPLPPVFSEDVSIKARRLG